MSPPRSLLRRPSVHPLPAALHDDPELARAARRLEADQPDDRTLGAIVGGESVPDHEITGLDDMLALTAHAGDALIVRRLLDVGAPVDGAR